MGKGGKIYVCNHKKGSSELPEKSNLLDRTAADVGWIISDVKSLSANIAF